MQPDPARAGRLHNSALSAARDSTYAVTALPGLMIGVLEDDGWREMVRPVDGQVFRHGSVAEWVLGDPWAGLNFKSWDLLYAILKRSDDGRRVMQMLVERGAPEDGFAEDVRQAKAAGKSLRQIAREKGVEPSTVLRSVAGRNTNEDRIRLGKDPARAAAAIVKARGLAYARELASAISAWRAQ